MTPKAQRIAIAEAYGLEICRLDMEGQESEYGKLYGNSHPFPDYLSDLNAMHDAESALDDKDYRKYKEILSDVVIKSWLKRDKAGTLFSSSVQSATATQRAETFLKTLNLWVETKGDSK